MTDALGTAVLSGAVVSHRGQLRPDNQDNYLLDAKARPVGADFGCESVHRPLSGWTLAAVFDGMGGGEGGEEAAAAAAAVFGDCLKPLARASSREQAEKIVREAFLEADRRILQMRKQRCVLGTTAVVLCTDGKEGKIFHLGDSRACLLRWGELFPLTQDHTLARFKRAAGLAPSPYPREEADRHILTRYIGCDPTGEHLQPEESDWEEFQPGDRMLLCSDGLWDACTHPELRGILQGAQSPLEQARAMTDLANRRGGEDNITAMVLAIP